MTGVGIVLLTWGIVAFVIGVLTLIIGILYMRRGKTYHDTKKALLIEAEKRVKLQYNKIATLPAKDFMAYLAGIFSRYLELDGELGTNLDNMVQERLFANAQADVLHFLGEDTLEAIEYYYGHRFVEKWSNLAYLILEKRRKLGGVVNGETRYEEIERLLDTELSTGLGG